MISLSESSYFRPLNPTDDDLNNYGLTRQQYNDWKKDNPDGKWRKFEKALMDPRFQAFFGAYSAMNGRYISAANAFNRTLPEEVEKRNRAYMYSDLHKAREFYNRNSTQK